MMIHKVRIKTLQQYAKAIGVLNKVGGGFSGIGPWEDAHILINDAQYDALIKEKVITPNKMVDNNNGAKKSKKKKGKS